MSNRKQEIIFQTTITLFISVRPKVVLLVKPFEKGFAETVFFVQPFF